ncbi:MAG: geranylgeranylglyceryl/heptaprenylglyceryl phosphate synthase [candidate division Zixibacteria bacterium RBG_16_48_11]|nr:MAG: geranylgeranylglyceryl/heptaprenylglyceryl phosphate synthase [candidate division Zixibacteria bacterium RBG_16_48_11]
MNVYQKLLEIREEKGAGFLVLLDPDRLQTNHLPQAVETYQQAGVDAFLVGSSLLLSNCFDQTIQAVKQTSQVPVIIFPGNSHQLSPHADAILYLSLISGRNPDFLIGEHVKSAGLLKEYNLEPISTGYIIIDSGKMTSVLYMSNTKPIPADKPDIAKAHALAAQYLGMKMIYLEAGSGAENHVPIDLVREVKQAIDIPVIVGGGIREPEMATRLIESGADFIVIGNALEQATREEQLQNFSQAIHWKKKR